jgi:hypothetical protein
VLGGGGARVLGGPDLVAARWVVHTHD